MNTIDLRELDATARLAARVEHVTGGGTANTSCGTGGIVVSAPPSEKFRIRLTEQSPASDDDADIPAWCYSFEAVHLAGDNLSWVIDTQGPSASYRDLPAIELNHNAQVPVPDTIVDAWLGDNGDRPCLLFSYTPPEAPNTVRVKQVNGAVDVAAASVINFDQADGLVLTDSGSGVVRVDILPATASQAGIVSLATQQLGAGQKTLAIGGSMTAPDAGADMAAASRVTAGQGATGYVRIGNMGTDGVGQAELYDGTTLRLTIGITGDYPWIINGPTETARIGFDDRAVVLTVTDGSDSGEFRVNINGTTGFAGVVAPDVLAFCLTSEASSVPTYQVRYGSTTYTGDTDTDALGNVFRGGICTAVGAGTIPTQYTDELAQDAVGSILTDSATIDFTYDDGTPSITAIVKDASITFAKMQAISTNVLLGNDASGTAVEEIACTAFARTLLDDADAATARTTLGITATGLPKSYIQGLALTYLSTTTISVAAGKCRDSADAADITLAAPVTVTMDSGSMGVINGTDLKTLSGTVATTSGSKTVTGTGTAFLTEFEASNTPRVCSGTITGAGTTITGTSTKFLTEFSVDDLIGTNAKGFSRITAIASDTSLTIVAAIPGGSPAGTTPLCLEQVHIQLPSATNKSYRVDTITSDTVLTLETNCSNTLSGTTIRAGGWPAVFTGGIPQIAYYLWLVSGGSGTGVIASNQRTTPFGLTGYTTSQRRIGSCLYYSSAGTAGVIAFTAERHGNAVRYIYVFESNAYGNRVVNAASVAAWTRISTRNLIPSTATELLLGAVLSNPAGTVSVNLRCASVDNYATLTSVHRVNAEAGGRSAAQFNLGCDGAQCFDWTLNTADANNPAVIEIGGYSEVLP